MFPRLRVLAAFFMLPVVLFTTASPASAAPGPWKSVTVTAVNPITEQLDVTCRMSLQQAGPGMPALNLGSNGYCTGGPDITPGTAQAGESGIGYVISVSGMTALSGTPCSGSTSGTLGAHPANGTIRVAGSISGSIISTGAPDCSITQVGIRFDGTNQDQFTWEGADLPALVDEEPTTEGCPHGYPHVSWEWRSRMWDGDPSGGYKWWDLHLNLRRDGAPLSTTQWGVAMIFADGGAAETDWTNKSDWVATTRLWPNGPPSGNPGLTPLGVELYAYDPAGWNSPVPDSRAPVIGGVVPTMPSQAYGGWTQPEHCRFWFGQKVVDDPNSDMDEPEGDGLSTYEEPPPPEDEPVLDPEPVIEEPTDLGWLAAIWALLKSILGTLVNLASTIVNGIVNGVRSMLQGLFVPDDQFLESKYEAVEAKWDATAPAKYLEAGTGLELGSVDGCAGLPLNVQLAPGVGIDEHIGAACSGSMASAAGVVRAVLSAVVVISGAMACIRALGSGLGWNPAVGREGGVS